jgi:hypothetical protein
MTKHRTITGFIAVALLAAATTAVTMRPQSSSADRAVPSASTMTIKELTAAAGKLPTEEFDDQTFVYSAKR